MRMKMLRNAAAMTVVTAALGVTAVGPAIAGTQAVTSVSGSLTCPAGKTVYIQAWIAGSPQAVSFYWPASRTTPNTSHWTQTVTGADTGSQSTTWKVTANSLGPVEDWCS